MKIDIVLNAKETVTLDNIDRHSTIEDILSKLPKYEETPSSSGTSNQSLPVLIHGKELENGKTLQEMNVKNRATLHYVFRPPLSMTIFITNSITHKTMIVECTSSSTIKSIKDIIRNRWNVPVDNQLLSFIETPLNEDNQTLCDYNVPTDSLLHLNIRMNIFIIDLASASDIVIVEAEPADTMYIIKMKIENKLKLYMPLEDIGINLIKAKVQNQTDYFKDSTLNLTLNLFEAEFRVFVDETNVDNNGQRKDIQLFTFNVEPSQTVQDVTTIIRNKMGSGINPWNNSDQGKSTYTGQWPCIGRLHGDGGMLLGKIFQKSPFDLNLLTRGGMLIFAQPKRPKKLNLEVEESFSIMKIKKLIKEKKFFPHGEPVLGFEDMDNLKDSFPLSHYKIGANAELRLKTVVLPNKDSQMRIFVRTLTHKTFSIETSPSDTIENLKEKISKVEGATVDQMRIIYHNKQLEDGNTLSDYGIKNEEQVDLIYRLRGC